MNEPLVSVVIPTYSRPIFLKRCITSVINQSYKNIEIFVVDDNNPDTNARFETEKAMQEFIGANNVCYLKHDRNRNGSAARNTGWRAATGKYITFIDDDDEIAACKIEKQVKCLEELDQSWGMCYTGYQVIKENGVKQVSSEKRSGNCYVDALMRTMFMGSGSNLFLRKIVVDEINGYDESFKRNQDIEFMVRALEHYKIAYIDENLLTIYQQGKRRQMSFEEVDSYARYYLSQFKPRINQLSKEESKRVYSVISLERARVAICARKYKEAYSIIRKNKVRLILIYKYFQYMLTRKITHASYGFNGK